MSRQPEGLGRKEGGGARKMRPRRAMTASGSLPLREREARAVRLRRRRTTAAMLAPQPQSPPRSRLVYSTTPPRRTAAHRPPRRRRRVAAAAPLLLPPLPACVPAYSECTVCLHCNPQSVTKIKCTTFLSQEVGWMYVCSCRFRWFRLCRFARMHT